MGPGDPNPRLGPKAMPERGRMNGDPNPRLVPKPPWKPWYIMPGDPNPPRMPKPRQKAAAGAGVSTSETNETHAAKSKVARAQALWLGDKSWSTEGRL
jgi:hypothetical protein